MRPWSAQNCGCAVAPTKTVDPNASPKSRLITLLLCIFVGGLGIHRFYVGQIGTGVLWLLTAGCSASARWST